MAYQAFSAASKRTRASATNTDLGASALIRIYSGPPPATPDSAPTGTLLSTLTGNSGGFGTVVLAGINNVNLGAGGSGYTSAPGVAFSGGGGTGAAATAVIAGGAVVAILVTNPGSGYTAAPTMTLTGGGGTGAAATAVTGVVLVAAPITQDSAAAASGTPGWARLQSSAGATVTDIDCSAPGGNGSMQILPAAITAGAPVTCGSFVLDEG